MKILFVRSGNNGIDPISTNQGESLSSVGCIVEYFDIKGNGLMGYLINIYKLRKKINNVNPDLVHSHYSLSGFVTSLTFTQNPVIVSLMGSDIISANKLLTLILRFFVKFIWSHTIVKSEEMFNKLNQKKVSIIPNGVNLAKFRVLNTQEAKKMLGWDCEKINILFGSSPNRPEKNFQLAQSAFSNLKIFNNKIDIHYLINIRDEDINLYYNAADILLLTSSHEGSPNVIKEAMACNCPIVSTDVGDVKEIISNVEGCYISSFDPVDISAKIIEAIRFGKRTEGRRKISNLSSEIIAAKIIGIYQDCMV